MTSVTALSEVDIANMALSNLGISIGIQSFNDKMSEAKACAFWYPKCRDQLLRLAPWNFAYIYIALASDGSQVPNTTMAYPGWSYAYQYPNDCLQAICVTNQYGQRYGQYAWWSYWGYPIQSTWGGLPKIPFKVVQSTATPNTKVILCDLPAPAYLGYIQCVDNTAQYDALFCDGLAAYLAARIGGPLRADAQKVAAASQMARNAVDTALTQCMNEAQQDPERPSVSISVR